MTLVSNVMLELHVPSFEIAKDFYGSLGFEVVWERPSVPTEEGYMVMRRGESVLNFYSGTEKVYKHDYFGQFPRDSKRGYGVEIIVPIVGIEQFYEQVKASHGEKINRPLNTKYNQPDFRMEDPFGYYLRFVEAYDWVNGRDKQGNSQ